MATQCSERLFTYEMFRSEVAEGSANAFVGQALCGRRKRRFVSLQGRLKGASGAGLDYQRLETKLWAIVVLNTAGKLLTQVYAESSHCSFVMTVNRAKYHWYQCSCMSLCRGCMHYPPALSQGLSNQL